jgi:hypothetical protein
MMEELLKPIIFSDGLSNISWLMVFYFVMLDIAFVMNITSSRVDKHLQNISDIRIKELLDILHQVISKVIFLGYFIASLVLLIPGTILLYNHKYGFLVLLSMILSGLTFIFDLVADIIRINWNKRITSILLGLSIILFITGNFTGY